MADQSELVREARDLLEDFPWDAFRSLLRSAQEAAPSKLDSLQEQAQELAYWNMRRKEVLPKLYGLRPLRTIESEDVELGLHRQPS